MLITYEKYISVNYLNMLKNVEYLVGKIAGKVTKDKMPFSKNLFPDLSTRC